MTPDVLDALHDDDVAAMTRLMVEETRRAR
jgi:hypothetical protein